MLNDFIPTTDFGSSRAGSHCSLSITTQLPETRFNAYPRRPRFYLRFREKGGKIDGLGRGNLCIISLVYLLGAGHLGEVDGATLAISVLSAC